MQNHGARKKLHERQKEGKIISGSVPGIYKRKTHIFLIFTQYCESFWASGHTKSFPLVLKKHEADMCLANAQWLHPDI